MPETRLQELERLCIKHGLPNWVVAVAIAESGWELNSQLCREANNPFGMGLRGNNMAYGPLANFSYYSSLEDAVLDFRKWMDEDICWANYSDCRKYSHFIYFLKNRRYNTETPTYYDNLQAIYNQYQKIKSHE